MFHNSRFTTARLARDPAGWLPAGLILLLLTLGFPALHQYNVTWDEALGDLFFGERYLSFFVSFDPVFLDFTTEPYAPGHQPDLTSSPFRTRPWEYYPVANTLAAATSAILSRGFGLLDPFDGFHALNLLLAAALIWFFFGFLHRYFGLVAAVTAIGLLFTSPRVVCDLMANIKDFPLMALYALALTAAFRALEAGSSWGLMASGALWGLALGTKANAYFLPLILILLLVIGRIPQNWSGRTGRLLLALAGAVLIGVAVLVASWPYLWVDPVGRILLHLDYVTASLREPPRGGLAPALPAILQTTPITFLILFAVGLVPVGRRAWRRELPSLLLLLWTGVVISRYLSPRAVNFDGVRHFLELFPAMAGIAGVGASWLVKRILGRNSAGSMKVPMSALLVILLLLPGVWSIARVHPFEIVYWNKLAGGYDGALRHNLPQAGDYWGMSYRLGLRWLNEHAPAGSVLAVPVVEHAVRLVSPVRLRPDIELLHITTPSSSAIPADTLQNLQVLSRRRPMYVMFIERREWANELMRECSQRLSPEAEWKVDGAPVLRIYRYVSPPEAD